MAFLKLIRFPNLVIIAAAQCLVKFVLFPLFDVGEALTVTAFSLLVVATVCIAAAGYIINDIEDLGIDRINKPNRVLIGVKFSEKNAFLLFVVLNILGVICGFIVANLVGRPNFAALFIFISALLYMYATFIKKMVVVGNILVAGLTAFVILIVGVFDLVPLTTSVTQANVSSVMQILLHYSIFAFVINLMREIVKDIIDINGDKNFDVKSIPIVMGRERAAQLVFALGLFTLLAVLYYAYSNFYLVQLMLAYFFIALAAPLLFFVIKAWNAEKREDFEFLSLLLKIIMVLGLGSIVIYRFI